MRYKTLIALAVLTGTGLLIGSGIYFTAKAPGGNVNHEYVAFDVSPDGKDIVFSSADADLYVFNFKTRKVRPLTKSTELETNPAFSPDGRSIAYSSRTKEGGGAGICVRSLDGTKTQALTDGQTAFDVMPSYSSDGKQITFVRAARHRLYSMGGMVWDNYDVYVINRNGSGLRRITHHGYYQASHPHFFEGSNRVVFAATGDYPNITTYLFAVPADGLLPAAKWMPPTASQSSPSLSGYGAWGSDPNVTSDGSRVAFISDRAHSFQYDLWVADATGGKPRALKITTISGYNQEPVWAGSDGPLLFLAGTEQDSSSRPIFSLWQVDQNGAHAHRIADSSLFTHPLRWKSAP